MAQKNASKRPAKKSKKASSLKTDTVFDFLYADNFRISYLLTQLDSYGVLTDATRQVKASDSVSGGVSAGIASIGGGEAQETSITKNYDTSWVPPLLLLKKLQDQNLIQKNISEANIGQIVEFKGVLSITDMTLVKSLSAASEHMSFDADANAGIQIVGSMPPSVQGTMKKGGSEIWFLGQSENWITHPNALMLSYGSTIGSGWKIIGILQSKPSASTTPSQADTATVGEGMRQYADTIKHLMGKPSNAYGITPLILLRPVN